MANPLVTIGIPTYNRPEGLRETLTRVLGQTYPHLDVIVSDNASADAEAVKSVVTEFKCDPRLRVHIQPTNLGPIGNFRYLVEQAKGEYFMLAADDDELDVGFVEATLARLLSNPRATLAMSGYEVVDQMAEPHIVKNLTRHFLDLRADTSFGRMKKFALQPDHLGKSRLFWGLFPTPIVQRAFADCLRVVPNGKTPLFGDIPVEFRALSRGELEVVPKNLIRVFLLPTSEGRKSLSGKVAKLLEIADRTFDAYRSAIADSSLEIREKEELLRIFTNNRRKAKVQLLVYYGIIGRFPKLARWIKKLWFAFA